MKLGIVADEIARDFASAVRVGVSLGLRRYEIRNLAAGRAPMCGESAMLEVERIAREEGVEITALSPGLFKNTENAAAFRREMDQVYPRAVEWAHRWKLPGLIVRAGGVGLKINYDPGNVAWLENRDPLDEFAVVAPWIANVHIKDLRTLVRGAGFPEWVPAGEGMIDYAAHFRALREIGYEGPVSLEPHMDSSAEATRRCKEAVERCSMYRETAP